MIVTTPRCHTQKIKSLTFPCVMTVRRIWRSLSKIFISSRLRQLFSPFFLFILLGTKLQRRYFTANQLRKNNSFRLTPDQTNALYCTSRLILHPPSLPPLPKNGTSTNIQVRRYKWSAPLRLENGGAAFLFVVVSCDVVIVMYCSCGRSGNASLI